MKEKLSSSLLAVRDLFAGLSQRAGRVVLEEVSWHWLSPASLRLCSTLNTGQTACAVSCKVQGCGASVETEGGGGCRGLQPRGDEESAGLSTCGPSRDSPVHTTSAL